MSDKLFTCPYNPVHVMRPTRAHHHLVDCRKANLHKNYEICTFNALHHYPPEQREDHLANCLDRIALVDSTYVSYETNSANLKRANLTMPPPPNIQFDDEENWSD